MYSKTTGIESFGRKFKRILRIISKVPQKSQLINEKDININSFIVGRLKKWI